jgi:hypothetical protein
VTETEYFSDSYKNARELFTVCATARGATLTAMLCSQRGPQDEGLALDIARIGEAGSKRVVVIISGTHGVEGYCGSACQTAWLSQVIESIPGVTFYLLHSLNPYGFAYDRRVNEENIDLNRNFLNFESEPLPANIQYSALETLLNPRSLDAKTLGNCDPALAEWFSSPEKVRAFKAAVGKGQYEFPQGIIFGGTKPTWSNAALRSFIRSLPKDLELGIVLDIHTGLGESGQLEIFTEETGDRFQQLKAWFPKHKVTTLGDKDSLGYEVTGSIERAFTSPGSHGPWFCITLEFGTRPITDVLLALQADNWLHCFASASDRLSDSVRAMMKDAFVVPSQQWRQQVTDTTLDVIASAIEALENSRWKPNEEIVKA